MTAADGGCGGHAGLGEELRVLVLSALDRIGPVLDRVRAEPATPGPETCAACPVCAVIAALRGERPELAVRMAEQAAELVAVLRAALEEGGPAASGGDAPEPARPARKVQHIRVDRPSP